MTERSRLQRKLDFSRRLNDLLNQRKISALELSYQVDQSTQNIVRWCAGKTLPHPRQVREVLEYFNDDLLATAYGKIEQQERRHAPTEDPMVKIYEALQEDLFSTYRSLPTRTEQFDLLGKLETLIKTYTQR